MQGASILAAPKVMEDSNRKLYTSAAATSGKDVFRNCLKKQTGKLDGSNQPTTTNHGSGDSQYAKLDRSALLRTPAADSSSADVAQPEQPTQDADKLVLDSSSDQVVSVDPRETPNDNEIADQSKEAADLESAQPQEPVMDSANLAVELLLPGIQVLPERIEGTIPQDMPTGEPKAVPLTLPVETPQQGQQETPDLLLQAISAPVPAPTPAPVTPESIQAMPAAGQEPLKDNQAKTSIDAVQIPNGDEATAVLTATALAPATVASIQPTARKADPKAQPVTNEVTTPENVIQAPVSLVSSPVEAPVPQTNDDSDQALPQDKAVDGKTSTAAKTEQASPNNNADALKVLAGKIEAADEQENTAADKKDSSGTSELKKLMAFESGRSQAVRLTKDSHETTPSHTAENREMVALTQTVEVKTAGDVLKTLGSDQTAKNPVEVKNLIDQLVQKAELTVKANSSEIKILLEPESLGRMTIKIAMEDGLLTARFTTDNHQVKHLLENNLGTLRQSLEAQGIKVEKTEVNVQLESGGSFGGYQEGRQELWQRPENPGFHGQKGRDAETYGLNLEEELPEAAFIQPDYYGIQTDGSMNFVV